MRIDGTEIATYAKKMVKFYNSSISNSCLYLLTRIPIKSLCGNTNKHTKDQVFFFSPKEVETHKSSKGRLCPVRSLG